MTIEEMKRAKRDLGLSNETLSRLSGVPFSSVQKFFSGKTLAPRQQTLLALEKALRTASGNRQGEYTIEDLAKLPDDVHVELIDGEIFYMEAPTLVHQIILGELHLQFRACADKHGKNCRVFLSPCDVQLDNDDKTMVQPDLFVVCREFDMTRRSFAGAPDLTIEILSDSTRSKDMLLKCYKYKNAGVREYWIIDPRRKEVMVYDFSNEDLQPKKYTFSDTIPVLLSGGECSIDFSIINEALS